MSQQYCIWPQFSKSCFLQYIRLALKPLMLNRCRNVFILKHICSEIIPSYFREVHESCRPKPFIWKPIKQPRWEKVWICRSFFDVIPKWSRLSTPTCLYSFILYPKRFCYHYIHFFYFPIPSSQDKIMKTPEVCKTKITKKEKVV